MSHVPPRASDRTAAITRGVTLHSAAVAARGALAAGVPRALAAYGVSRHRLLADVGRLKQCTDTAYGPVAFGLSARSTTLTDWPPGGFVGPVEIR